MVEHIVLFRWKETATQAEVDAALAGLRGLKDQIPGILDLNVGVNFTDRAQGFTHGLVVRFTDKAALETYGPHPAHQAVVQNNINPIRADIIAFDFEI